jgi:hypothetical protein
MIVLDDLYTIETDTYNYTLKYKESKGINEETGKEQFSKSESYFPTLKQALLTYMNYALKPSESIDDILVRLDEVEAVINRI